MPNSTTMTARQFRTAALTLVGLPYVLGAEWRAPYTARPAALDCSELVEGLFALAGAPIGDLAASQFDKTRALKYGETPRVGDLVFLRNNPARWNGIGHVAVITAKLDAGDWEIVEARGRKWGIVRSTLNYWRIRRYFTGVRRYDPLTFTDPVPVNSNRDFRFVLANIQAKRWSGGPYTDDASELKRLAPSILVGNEADEDARNVIRTKFGYDNFLTWPIGMTGLFWRKDLWTHGGHKDFPFGTRYHGAIRVPLTSRRNNSRTMDVIGMHVRPADSYPGKSEQYIIDAKRDQIDDALAELVRKDKTTIVAGDMNTRKANDVFERYGLQEITMGSIDKIFVTPNLITRAITPHDPGKTSDHKWWLYQGTLPGSNL